jgi:CDP-diacylglycerol--serine O-phosphatidyltransferase
MLPTILTIGNLMLGFTAIALMTLPQTVGWGAPRLETSVWCIVLAGALDAVDGPIARLRGGGPTPWGHELDSMADLVSFGLAPAVLLGVAVQQSMRLFSVLAGAIYVLSGAWRLARYIWSGSRPHDGRFEGMPITAAGLAIAAFWLFEMHLWGGVVHAEAAFLLVILCSLLMISRIEYEKFPELGRRDRRNTLKWWIAGGAILLIVVRPALTGLPIALLYIAHGPLKLAPRLIPAVTGVKRKRKGN